MDVFLLDHSSCSLCVSCSLGFICDLFKRFWLRVCSIGKYLFDNSLTLKIRPFQSKLAENAFVPIPLGKGCFE